ncbi:hypothetical protein BN1723_000561 [Verticillium longisporum]|uniref:Nuclear speckle splicing regulatory protein 1 N-terminal domain-containing protein n=1 Tax=Verticillium longisporum TaxID=100787 RepID=A0A0G4M5U7_VERLO|nr:hypothetical protein BN1723_000561 [Verticillium longisporum]
MSKPGGISFGLNLSKKPGLQKKPALAKRKPFGGNDDSDDDNSSSTAKPTAGKVQAIGGLDGFDAPGAAAAGRNPEDEDEGDDALAQRRKAKAKRNAPPAAPPTLKARKNQESALFGDLAGALTARRNAAAAEAVDPSVYDYDGVYDALKAAARRDPTGDDDEEAEAARKPRYMKSGDWQLCFETRQPPALPSIAYLGFSAETGELHDNHDIISVAAKNLYTAPGKNKNPSTPGSGQSSSRGAAPAKEGGSWTWFFGKIILFILVLGAAYVGYTAWRAKNDKRHRF